MSVATSKEMKDQELKNPDLIELKIREPELEILEGVFESPRKVNCNSEGLYIFIMEYPQILNRTRCHKCFVLNKTCSPSPS
jgi:hypothetical protein